MAQIVLGFLPAVAFAAQQSPKARIAEQNPGCFRQVQAQTVNGPDRKRQSQLMWITLQQAPHFIDVRLVCLRWMTRAMACRDQKRLTRNKWGKLIVFGPRE